VPARIQKRSSSSCAVARRSNSSTSRSRRRSSRLRCASCRSTRSLRLETSRRCTISSLLVAAPWVWIRRRFWGQASLKKIRRLLMERVRGARGRRSRNLHLWRLRLLPLLRNRFSKTLILELTARRMNGRAFLMVRRTRALSVLRNDRDGHVVSCAYVVAVYTVFFSQLPRDEMACLFLIIPCLVSHFSCYIFFAMSIAIIVTYAYGSVNVFLLCTIRLRLFPISRI
jgi:hypothetical protein